MFGISLQRESNVTLPRQLHQALVALILENRLQAGDLLPSTREMAKILGVSRNTVTEAYEMLRAEGYITCRLAASCRVKNNLALPSFAHTDPAPQKQPGSLPLRFDFRMGIPDLTCFPFTLWNRMLAKTQAELRRQDYLYGFPQGYHPLRKEIALWLFRSRGIRVTAEDVFITTGTTQTINMSIDLLRQKDNAFLLETPCYFAAINALDRFGIPYTPVQVDARGMRVEDIAIGEGQSVAGIYITPSHQFPLGGVLSATRRVALIRLARMHDFYILEDDYDGEFRHSGPPLTPLYALDPERVLYMGTFSKSLFPSLRIGFVLVPKTLRERWSALRNSLDRQSPTAEQAALATFLQSGKAERHIRTMGGIYAKKLMVLSESIQTYVQRPAYILGEKAGMHVAIQVPGARCGHVFRERCAKNGIGLSPCRFFAFDEEFHFLGSNNKNDLLFLGYGNIAASDIPEGVKKLAAMLPFTK